MQPSPLIRLGAVMAATLTLGLALAPAGGVARAADFADSAFLRAWQRVDAPVAAQQAARSWYWGPKPLCSAREPYLDAPDGSGTHLVQYFDKSRMEINNSAADPTAPWYVTNGLLAYELIAGLVQTGNTTYETRAPADIPLAGDLNDANAPTYRTFQLVTSTPAGAHLAPSALGRPVTATINRAGAIGADPSKVYYPGTVISYYDSTTKHNVPRVFWDFINASGPVLENGRLQQARLSDPPLFVTGLPISEAYWARVLVGGQPTDVLIQAFQRRVLTYAPALAAPWQVQMGNIGAHYLLWRYGAVACSGTPIPAPTATATPGPAAQQALPLYRLINSKAPEHFYTIDPGERAQLIAGSYRAEATEGRVWNQRIPDTVPLYRLYNNRTGAPSRHLLTTSVQERDYLVSQGWVVERGPNGIGAGGGYVYLAQAPQTVPLYRWYNPVTDDHLYTISTAPAGKNGYKLEGIACYVIRP
jgi:hypothetical protein